MGVKVMLRRIPREGELEERLPVLLWLPAVPLVGQLIRLSSLDVVMVQSVILTAAESEMDPTAAPYIEVVCQ